MVIAERKIALSRGPSPPDRPKPLLHCTAIANIAPGTRCDGVDKNPADMRDIKRRRCALNVWRSGNALGLYLQVGQLTPMHAIIDRHFGPIFGNGFKADSRWHRVGGRETNRWLRAAIVDEQCEHHNVTGRRDTRFMCSASSGK